MERIQAVRVATELILAGLDRDDVIRGLQVELDLPADEAETAWKAANEKLD